MTRNYRLTNAEGIYGTISYAYDKVGNRTERIHDADQHDQYTYYPGTNRLRAITGTHAELFQYDADGNTTQRIPGAANTLPEITDPPQFDYNSSGQRTRKEAAATIYYHYDQSGQLIAETDTAGALLKAYIWLHGQPLAMIDATGELYYYHIDHLGTPQKMTRANSTEVVWAADYLPFGQADVIVVAVESNLRFAGQYYDGEAGLHYNWNRYYDPSLGRYLRADPVHSLHPKGIEIPFLVPWLLEIPQDLHSYSYVGGDPINWFDSTGLEGEHTSNARRSTLKKHEDGQARKKKYKGGEKADKERRPHRKKPKGWKGKWPPTGVGAAVPCLTSADCYCWENPVDCCLLFPEKCACEN
jgi:RHS repeat-associated protein